MNRAENDSDRHRQLYNIGAEEANDEVGNFIRVTYDGLSSRIFVRWGESILSALERNANKVRSELSLSFIPHQCRRGNCLTCVGRHTACSDAKSIRVGEHGMNPDINRKVHEKGFAFLCSSYAVGDGLELELDQKDDAWKYVYGTLMKNSKDFQQEIRAKSLRVAAERNLSEWKRKTEEVFKNSI